jgi:4-diphosphocytidyl-2-C-methyl-D-erythritol kinase
MSSEHSTGITIACPAKINLGLSILGKRKDGFHELETLFQALDWTDRLVLRPGEGDDSLRVTGPFSEGVPNDSGNVVLRAIGQLRSVREFPPIQIQLDKNIPHGSGLGGGSSDAAGAVVAANLFFGLSLENPEIERLTSRVSSDAAFFVVGGSQWGRGRGEVLKPIAASRSLIALVAVPTVSVSTREAYGAVSSGDWGSLFSARELEAWMAGESKALPEFPNAFEEKVASLYPRVGETLVLLAACGAKRQFLSGSGSACVGLFDSLEEAEAAARKIAPSMKTCRVCRSLSVGVHPEPFSRS